MSAALIFAGAFILLIAITFIVPVLPPAQLLHDFLNIPQPTMSIWGVPLALLNGVINGLFWGIIAAAAYSLSRHLRRKPLAPLPVTRDLNEPPPKPMPLDYRADKYPPAFTIRRKRGRTDQDVETIEGIGSLRGRMLRTAGIRSIDDLLRAGATRRGRQRLAREVGVSYATMHRWVCRGDLLRVRGIGKQYSELLEAAGVATVTDLSMRIPRFLWQTLRDVNRERRLVRRIPPSKTIQIWVYRAKNLEPIVK
jgi:predicted flap endonuclease-1-like 5' DNA nuclease